MSITVTARANPTKITGGGGSTIAVRVTDSGAPVPGQAVTIAIAEGYECGRVENPSLTTRDDGSITATFRGTEHVQNCEARLQVRVPGATADAAPAAEAVTGVLVHTGPAIARIDGISAIALVLILSFAIDRIVRGLFFALSYVPAWSRAFPDPGLDDVPATRRGEANRRVAYFAATAALAVVAIGWLGQVRLLAALGFTAVNPWLDIVATGLVLTAGAERTERILQSLGAGSATPPAPAPAPIEITGRLTIDEESKRRLGV